MKRPHLLALSLLLLAAAAAGWRWHRSGVALAGETLRFTEINDLRWEAAKRRLTRTGHDPYLVVEVPATVGPLCEAVFEFGGRFAPTEGVVYLLQSPAFLVEPRLTLLEPQVQRSADGFVVRARLRNSGVLRIDLPDYLVDPVEFRRVTVRGRFLDPAQPACIAMGVLAAAALGVLGWPALRAAIGRRPWLEWAVLAGLLGAKLWVATDVQPTYLSHLQHDDLWFVERATTILEGKWLGDFNELTLAKGPVFPLFLAGVGALGLPLLQVETLFHALAVLAFVFAVRPVVRAAGARLLLGAVLLGDPLMLSSETVARVLRSGIQPALTLLAVGGTIGLIARLDRSWRTRLAWGLGAGLAWAAFGYCREESVWLVPSLAVMLVGGAIVSWRQSGRWARLSFLLLPVGVLLAANATLQAINARAYGVWVSLDVRDGAFPGAYGALLRIVPVEAIPQVALAKEVRQRAYAVSPAFAELAPLLDGPAGQAWAKYGWEGCSQPWAHREIRSGWTQWALREAATRAGHGSSARAFEAFWGRVAREIDAACDDGRLQAGPRRTGFFPRWQPAFWRPLGPALADGLATVALQKVLFPVHSPPSIGAPEDLARFRRITHQLPPAEPWTPNLRTDLRQWTFHLYRFVGGPAALLALGASVVLGVGIIRRRTGLLELAIIVALGGGVCTLVAILALVQVTSFPAINPSYLAPAAALCLALSVLAPWWAWCLRRRSPKA